ncbi:hypothetical protein PGTUg99_027747 [Puccinia graminis f. sp. tritici]|uniref:Uncharacterized protein n=1 Tax=Puccinia graminis f. sp. tritici TaxID=56615 RepID=A0A5B0PNP2_PUCGR|nr:hypothetical protein PGTUg99_027747 [Puccinia graminis f. sp. tritici]
MAEVDIASHDLMTKTDFPYAIGIGPDEDKSQLRSVNIEDQASTSIFSELPRKTNSQTATLNLSLSFINLKLGTPNSRTTTLTHAYSQRPAKQDLVTLGFHRRLSFEQLHPAVAATSRHIRLGSYPRGHRKNPHNLGPSVSSLLTKFTKPIPSAGVARRPIALASLSLTRCNNLTDQKGFLPVDEV